MNKNIWGVLACRGKGWLKDMSRMIFPLTCEVCGTALVEGERVLCLGCMAAMPGVDCDPDSDLARRLSATVRVEKVAAMFVYRRDTTYGLSLIHHRRCRTALAGGSAGYVVLCSA